MIRAYIGDCKNLTNAVKVSSKYGEKFYVWEDWNSHVIIEWVVL